MCILEVLCRKELFRSILNKRRLVNLAYCKNCGNQIEVEGKFCKLCGTPVTSQQNVNGNLSPNVTATSTGQSESSFSKVSKGIQNLTAKQKKLGFIFIALLVVLFSAYKIVEYFTSSDRLVSTFVKAVEEKDSEKLLSILTYSNSGQKISEENITSFIDFLHNNQGVMDELTSSMEEQSHFISDSKDQKVDLEDEEAVLEYLFGSNDVTPSFIHIEPNGTLLFFDKYQLVIDPYFVAISSNLAGTKIFQGEKEIATIEEDGFDQEIGPFLPGEYAFSAHYSNPFGDMQQEEKVIIDGYGYAGVYFDFPVQSVYFYDPFQLAEQGVLYINGEKVDNFNPLSGETFGPVLLDGSLKAKVEAEFPWGTEESVETVIENDSIELVFPFDTSLQDQVVTSLKEFNISYLESLETGSVSDLLKVSDDFKNVLNYEMELPEENHNYQIKLDRIDVDPSSFEIGYYWGSPYLSLVTYEEVEDVYYEEGVEPELSLTKLRYSYDLEFSNGEWLVSDKTAIETDAANFDKKVPVLEDTKVYQMKSEDLKEDVVASDEEETEIEF